MFINNTCNLFDFIYSVKECEDPGDVANATKYGGFRYGESVTPAILGFIYPQETEFYNVRTANNGWGLSLSVLVRNLLCYK